MGLDTPCSWLEDDRLLRLVYGHLSFCSCVATMTIGDDDDEDDCTTAPPLTLLLRCPHRRTATVQSSTRRSGHPARPRTGQASRTAWPGQWRVRPR